MNAILPGCCLKKRGLLSAVYRREVDVYHGDREKHNPPNPLYKHIHLFPVDKQLNVALF